MTPNPHTKFEHNRPSRFRDTEARCEGISARAHVQRYPQGRIIRGFEGARAPPEHESAPSHYQKHPLKMKGKLNETPFQTDIQLS